MSDSLIDSEIHNEYWGSDHCPVSVTIDCNKIDLEKFKEYQRMGLSQEDDRDELDMEDPLNEERKSDLEDDQNADDYEDHQFDEMPDEDEEYMDDDKIRESQDLGLDSETENPEEYGQEEELSNQ